jgi:regulator of RNase E activity RraA
MELWKNDKELYTIAKKELFVALVGDILDKLGYRHQFLPPLIKPLRSDFVVIGRAMTVLEADVFEEETEESRNPLLKKPFGIMFEALDDLKEDEVYICSGSSNDFALWGGLMSTRAIKLGAAGAVLNGWSRDTDEILNLNFPAFSFGGYAQDQGPRGKVIDYRVPIEIEGVRINTGDMVYGDRDGVLIIPKVVVKEVFEGASEKARGEQMVKKALEQGMSTVDAFNKFGIM